MHLCSCLIFYKTSSTPSSLLINIVEVKILLWDLPCTSQVIQRAPMSQLCLDRKTYSISNANNGQNRNQISGRGGQGQGPSGRGRGNYCMGCGNNPVANTYSFEVKMKDSLISKLIITKTGHQSTQYKKIINTLPILCIDNNY